MSLRVERVGTLALSQDLGRAGYAHQGMTGSGAADTASLRQANALVGNEPGAPALEIIGDFTAVAEWEVMIAITGAQAFGPITMVDPWQRSIELPAHEAAIVPAGARITLGPAVAGLRTYLSLRGGVDQPHTLGSAATDTLSGLGPPPLRAGDLLRPAQRVRALRTIEPVPGTPVPGPLLMLSAFEGPRTGWIRNLERLFSSQYQVTEYADRIGTRLAGPSLQQAHADDVPSEGIVRGAVQIPPDGQPLIFGPDHPVTGGYPVVAVLAEHAQNALAQARAGQAVRFRRAGAWSGQG